MQHAVGMLCLTKVGRQLILGRVAPKVYVIRGVQCHTNRTILFSNHYVNELHTFLNDLFSDTQQQHLMSGKLHTSAYSCWKLSLQIARFV